MKTVMTCNILHHIYNGINTSLPLNRCCPKLPFEKHSARIVMVLHPRQITPCSGEMGIVLEAPPHEFYLLIFPHMVTETRVKLQITKDAVSPGEMILPYYLYCRPEKAVRPSAELDMVSFVVLEKKGVYSRYLWMNLQREVKNEIGFGHMSVLQTGGRRRVTRVVACEKKPHGSLGSWQRRSASPPGGTGTSPRAGGWHA